MPGTFTATSTFRYINKARMIDQGDTEISRIPLNFFDFAVGDQIYVYVPADLDQFGRDHSHGTVIGREGLVQTGHHPADAR